MSFWKRREIPLLNLDLPCCSISDSKGGYPISSHPLIINRAPKTPIAANPETS